MNSKREKIIDIKNCPLRKALKVLGGKWVMIIINNMQTPRRYGELKRLIPDISEKMLIEKLRLLEENKFVSRKNFKQIPPKVEYSLLKRGKDAAELIPALAGIGKHICGPTC